MSVRHGVLMCRALSFALDLFLDYSYKYEVMPTLPEEEWLVLLSLSPELLQTLGLVMQRGPGFCCDARPGRIKSG